MFLFISAPQQALACLVFSAVCCCVLIFNRFNRSHGLPPGPRPLPIIGNAHQVSIESPEKTFAQWSKLYGDVIFVRMFSRPTLIVNSRTAVRELLVKRSGKYSDRPPSILMSELLGWRDALPFMNMGERHKKQRRWIHSTFFASSSLNQFTAVQARAVRVLLVGLARRPEDYAAHLHRFSSSLMLEGLYGHTVTSDDDENLIYVETASQGTSEIATPGAAIVDFLPFLRWVPTWLPGADFKRKAAKANVAIHMAHINPYELVERLMAAGEDKPSLVKSLIEEYTSKGTLATERQDIMSIGAISYVAIVLYPEALRKAQDEIDRVVGNDRIPDLCDRNSLPYLDCMLREVYRWHCPGPLGAYHVTRIPHALSEEDEYRGYKIPKGCIIIPNMWFMTRDAELYPEPEVFRPERFWGLSEEEMEDMCPRNIIFGYGRRICPGRRFADTSIWLSMAAIVATLDVEKARTALGEEITPSQSFIPGAVR
ncbi:cytochrome P450 monooxygenase [Fomitopsis serialis]|uniref:cytochrome P450 monooxygenase n=1 Tax=Fomitopsis serialis TaxID=139415 RepID=UPI002007D3E8|nr:cytochrome P450 monooxygenase [Neoantrodia serialis]KAH9917082.1 cytochrome P450 monooxygenase [Neoantrodia serialis]